MTEQRAEPIRTRIQHASDTSPASAAENVHVPPIASQNSRSHPPQKPLTQTDTGADARTRRFPFHEHVCGDRVSHGSSLPWARAHDHGSHAEPAAFASNTVPPTSEQQQLLSASGSSATTACRAHRRRTSPTAQRPQGMRPPASRAPTPPQESSQRMRRHQAILGNFTHELRACVRRAGARSVRRRVRAKPTSAPGSAPASWKPAGQTAADGFS